MCCLWVMGLQYFASELVDLNIRGFNILQRCGINKQINCNYLTRVQKPSVILVFRIRLDAYHNPIRLAYNQISSVYRSHSIRQWPDNLISYTNGHSSWVIWPSETCITFVSRSSWWLHYLLEFYKIPIRSISISLAYDLNLRTWFS